MKLQYISTQKLKYIMRMIKIEKKRYISAFQLFSNSMKKILALINKFYDIFNNDAKQITQHAASFKKHYACYYSDVVLTSESK